MGIYWKIRMKLKSSCSLETATDEYLMQCVAHGEKMAFEVLYTRYAPRLQGFFSRMLGRNYEKARDFTQEIFLKIYYMRTQYDNSQTFSSWIFTMAYNMCKNEYRHLAVVEEHVAFQLTEPILAEGPLFEKEYDKELFDQALKQAMQQLSPESLAILTLRYEEELPISEIARILSCPEGTVKSRIHYALRYLAQELSQYHPSK